MDAELDALLAADEEGRARLERVTREARRRIDQANEALTASRTAAAAAAEEAVLREIAGIHQRADEAIACRARVRDERLSRAESSAARRLHEAVASWCRIIEEGPVP